ncbi:DUF1963 domain-containing protein [Leucothrix arctica]|uniref:DUF1963 domain-containing protein n=1 Tax=Leucothrix arctica TaxID=1481894 RepID=A0A317CE56_9GAMM|nr:DUF1963 domain-containing protein [Leucothrix arctica]PWQ94580.1 hypothetical protein DKT75_14890 [Leucothrix arctica]
MTKIFDIFKNKSDTPPELWSEVEPLVAPYKKETWVPATTKGSTSYLASKFSGIPALLKGEEWPCCGSCKKPMQLFVQLNSNNLPDSVKGIFGDGLLQAFYCTNSEDECDEICESYFPFSKATSARLISLDESELVEHTGNLVEETFPEKQITDWEAQDDYPNWEELEDLGVKLTEEHVSVMREMGFPREKDKLLGWPNWIQGVEYPSCPECNKAMKLVFQIDSEDNLPFMFGDAGCAHITQCEEHKEQLTIAWACG